MRVSVSYLFRIKVDGVYMLIKGRRWDQYQPVGGVYKFSAGAKALMETLGVLDDDLISIDAYSLHDLRVRVPAKNLVRFVSWFEQGHSRETGPWREFYEELIAPGILAAADFPFILEDFIRRDIRKIRFSQFAQSQELMIADIYELLPTEAQLTALRELKATGCPELVWVTESQIRHLGVTPGENLDMRIGDQTIWTL